MNIKGLMTYLLTVYPTIYGQKRQWVRFVTHELFDCCVQASQ